MPQVIESTVYTIEELSDAAKEAARGWYREACLDYEWYDAVYEDFGTICGILGVTLGTNPVKLVGGGTRGRPRIFFRGFGSQGDGASFAGSYRHVPGAARAVRAYAPRDTELHRIADSLQNTQKRNFWQLHAIIRQEGRYCHEHSMAIEVERDSPTWQPPAEGAEDAVIEALRDLARWLYRQLQDTYEHESSDAAVDETMVLNEFTFTADGRHFG